MSKLSRLLLLALPWFPGAVLAQSSSSFEGQQGLEATSPRVTARRSSHRCSWPTLPRSTPLSCRAWRGQSRSSCWWMSVARSRKSSSFRPHTSRLAAAALEAAPRIILLTRDARSPARLGTAPLRLPLRGSTCPSALREVSGPSEPAVLAGHWMTRSLFVDGNPEPVRTEPEAASLWSCLRVNTPWKSTLRVMRGRRSERRQRGPATARALPPGAAGDQPVRDGGARGPRAHGGLPHHAARAELREVPGTMGDPFRVVMLLPGVGSMPREWRTRWCAAASRPPRATIWTASACPSSSTCCWAGGAPPGLHRHHRLLPGLPAAQVRAADGRCHRRPAAPPREDRVHGSAYADLINTGVFVEQPFESTGTSVSLAGRISYSALLLSLLASPSSGRVHASIWDYQARVEQKLGEGRLRLFALGSSDGLGLRSDANEPASHGRRPAHPLSPGGPAEASTRWAEARRSWVSRWGVDELGLLGEQGAQRVGEFTLRQASVAAGRAGSRQLTRALDLTLGADTEHRRAALSITGTALPPGSRTMDLSDPLQRPSSLATLSGGYLELQWSPAGTVVRWCQRSARTPTTWCPGSHTGWSSPGSRCATRSPSGSPSRPERASSTSLPRCCCTCR